MNQGSLGRGTAIVMAAAAVVVLSLPGFTAEPSSTLAVGSKQAGPGTTITVPVSVVDLTGTPLGEDQPRGRRIQGISFRIGWLPEAVVSDVSVQRAGVTKNLEPLFEANPQTAGSVSWLASFAEARGPIGLRMITREDDREGDGDVVAEVTLTIAAEVPPGTVIKQLRFMAGFKGAENLARLYVDEVEIVGRER